MAPFNAHSSHMELTDEELEQERAAEDVLDRFTSCWEVLHSLAETVPEDVVHVIGIKLFDLDRNEISIIEFIKHMVESLWNFPQVLSTAGELVRNYGTFTLIPSGGVQFTWNDGHVYTWTSPTNFIITHN